MASLDLIFANEFRAMSQQRAGISGALSLYNLPLPDNFNGHVDGHKRVYISGVMDEYYSKLNKTEAIHWTKPNLKRRKFGANGQFLKDKNGKTLVEDVTLPQGCAAIVSKICLKVPLKYTPKNKESFVYVDCMNSSTPDGGKERNFIYILPKKYCYAVNQLALVLSLNKLRNFYYGQEMVLQSGHTVYLYVIPYKPTSTEKPYRVLMTKTRNDFSSEIDSIIKLWLKLKILYPLEITQLSEPIRGSLNVAYKVLCDTQEEFVRFNPDKSLADETEDLDMNFGT